MPKPTLPTIENPSQVDNELDSLIGETTQQETKLVEQESKPIESPSKTVDQPGKILQVETAVLVSRSIELPILEGISFGYSSRHHTMNFSTQEATLLRGWIEGLKKQEAKLPNGKIVVNLNDAVRWLAHQFEQQ